MLSTLIVALAIAQVVPTPKEPSKLVMRAWLESPGGELPFGLELIGVGKGARAVIVNDPERIEVPVVRWDGFTLELELPPYDSKIAANVMEGQLYGKWSKRRSDTKWIEMKIHGRDFDTGRFPPGKPEIDVSGRWAVDFENDESPAIGLFEQRDDGTVTGTFLTTVGDYRYLAGSVVGRRLRLSCFDGAHAFLFHAEFEDERLTGDFWSSVTWHETWSAERSAAPDASMPNPFELTRVDEQQTLGGLRYPDLDGELRALDAPEFRGEARILQVFGSWCPNCGDASRLLGELERAYRDRGLHVLGLAFELTSDRARNANRVREYLRRHGAEYDVLLAGPADKAEASKAFPLIDRVRAYPTTIFMDRNGVVRAVHTGFSGPATGPLHERLRHDFEQRIESLLGEAK